MQALEYSLCVCYLGCIVPTHFCVAVPSVYSGESPLNVLSGCTAATFLELSSHLQPTTV